MRNRKSARAALNLAAILEYRTLKEEEQLMANRKTAKKKRLKKQKKQEQALQYVQSKLGGSK
jgi:hypothetical protein